jgi:hypothetical protein
MPAATEPDRRFTFALTAAVAATTIAVGVTAATLLGWFRTSDPPPQAAAAASEPAVVYVPIAPTPPPDPPAAAPADSPSERFAMDALREHGEREHEQEDDDD